MNSRPSTVPAEGFEMARTRDELVDLCGNAADILIAAHQYLCRVQPIEAYDPTAAKILRDTHRELLATYSWLVAMQWDRQPAERAEAA